MINSFTFDIASSFSVNRMKLPDPFSMGAVLLKSAAMCNFSIDGFFAIASQYTMAAITVASSLI